MNTTSNPICYHMKKIKIKFLPEVKRVGLDYFILKVLNEYFDVEECEDPDFIFYSVLSHEYLNYNCVRIFLTQENVLPDFNICDYAIAYPYLEFEDRYMRYPLYLLPSPKKSDSSYEYNLELAEHKHENVESLLEEKTGFCSYVVSNGRAAKCRQDIFESLSDYKTVNSGSRFMNSEGGPVKSKLQFQKKHKFAIAFENTSTSGYNTEKLMQAFAAQTIPIYWGDTSVAKVFNPKSFINCHDYGLTAYDDSRNEEAIRKIVERVKEIDNNDDLYMSMIKEPAFLPSYSTEKEREKLERFLVHLFEQEPEDAFRRNKYFWGHMYETKQKIGNKVYWILHKVLPVKGWIENVRRKVKN